MRTLGVALAVCLSFSAVRSDDKDNPWVVYQGGEGPGKGKHIVLVSGDEEYRSEETLPQLGKILAKRHGFKCTVLFAIDPKTGFINPDITDNIPGLEHLKQADLMVLFTRMRNLPDEQMKHIVDYVNSEKPIVALRTATHAFALKSKTYHDYDWQNKGGFGRKVLGDTWVSHWGDHGKESTRGIIAPEQGEHPILKGIKDGDIWGPTDVYEVRLPQECVPLVLGQVLAGMKPADPPVKGKKNEPMIPVAWTKQWKTDTGKPARVFTTTMGASTDFESVGLRRLLVNACYWSLLMDNQIPAASNVDIVGTFRPRPFSFGGFEKGKRPADLEMK